MSDRIPCTSSGCARTILPSTALETGGFCQPCVQRRAREERAEYVRTHRVDIDPFVGVADPVEVITLIHAERRFDELNRYLPCGDATDAVYASLSPDDQLRVAAYARSLLADHFHASEQIARCLAAFTDASLDYYLSESLAGGEIPDGILFRGARPEIRERLFDEIEIGGGNPDRLRLDRALTGLSWIGDAVVVERFNHWKNQSPEWASALHRSPHEYAQCAGWSMDEAGSRLDLFSPICHALRPTSDSGTFPDAGFLCQWCGQPARRILTGKTNTRSTGPGHLPARHVSISTCENCSAFGTYFTAIRSDGTGAWSPFNVRPDSLAEWVKTEPPRIHRTLAVDQVARRPHHAADQFLPTTFSQIGGMPTWIQDPEFPECPGCSALMMFVGQISYEDIDQHGEGMTYASVCHPCGVAATTYQQT